MGVAVKLEERGFKRREIEQKMGVAVELEERGVLSDVRLNRRCGLKLS